VDFEEEGADGEEGEGREKVVKVYGAEERAGVLSLVPERAESQLPLAWR